MLRSCLEPMPVPLANGGYEATAGIMRENQAYEDSSQSVPTLSRLYRFGTMSEEAHGDGCAWLSLTALSLVTYNLRVRGFVGRDWFQVDAAHRCMVLMCLQWTRHFVSWPNGLDT
jgi:hypothetical protein